MSALRGYRWWTWVGLVVVLIGNALTVALWTWAVFATTPGARVRYFFEAGAAAFIAAATLILAIPFVIAGLVKESTRVATGATMIFAITPFPLGFVVLRMLAAWRDITLLQ